MLSLGIVEKATSKTALIYGPDLLVVETKNQAINNQVINVMVIRTVQTSKYV